MTHTGTHTPTHPHTVLHGNPPSGSTPSKQCPEAHSFYPSSSPFAPKKPDECPSFLSGALPLPPSLPGSLLSSNILSFCPFSTFPPGRSVAQFCPQVNPRSRDKCEWAGTGYLPGVPFSPSQISPGPESLHQAALGLMCVQVALWPVNTCSPPLNCRESGLKDGVTVPAWAFRRAPGRLGSSPAASCSLN